MASWSHAAPAVARSPTLAMEALKTVQHDVERELELVAAARATTYDCWWGRLAATAALWGYICASI